MQWKVIPCALSKPTLKTLGDPRLSDGAIRTYVWLLGQETADDSSFGQQRRVGVDRVREELNELSGQGLIEMDEVEQVVRILSPQESRNRRQDVLDQAKLRHEEKRKAVEKRRAERKFTQKPEKVKKETISARTVEAWWKEAWKETFPGTHVLKWGVKELSIAKKLLQLFGPQDTRRAVELTIRNWSGLVSRYNLRGYPSLNWIMAYRQTAVLELLSGTKIGRDVPERAGRKRALEGSEYNEEQSREEADVGWGRNNDSDT